MRGNGSLNLFLANVLVILATVGVVTGAEAGQVVFEGGFNINELVWQADGRGGVLPILPETHSLAEPQRTALLRQELTFLVPLNLAVKDLQIEVLESHREEVPGHLAVTGPLFTEDGQSLNTPRLPLKGDRFPHFWGEFTGSHLWRGYQLATVTIYPVREVLDSNGTSVEILDSFAIRVVTDGTPGPEPIRRERFIPGEREANEEILQRVVHNPETVRGYFRDHGQVVAEPAVGFKPTRTPSLSGSAVSYLIITNDAMAEEFQRLADYRTKQGIPAVVATREYIAANFRNGADIQETIRMFIRDAYQKWGVEYVLLGGDSDVLPARYITNTFYPTVGSTDIPTDLYFACLDGNWNLDGDDLYGEPMVGEDVVDDADFAEEVYLGRAPVSTADVAAVFVDKVIAYEGAASGDDWTNRVMFAAEVLFPDDYEPGDQIALDGAQFAHATVRDMIQPCTTMEYLRMYETDVNYERDLPLTVDAVIDTFNSGHYGLVNQIGHGYYFNMSVGDGNFVTSQADALTNGDKLFVIYSLNCASAAFDFSCLMERFIQNPNGGAVAAIGAARAAFPVTANAYQQEFFDQLFCGGENRLGRLIALSRLPFLGSTAHNYLDRWTFENYTLLGDPALAMWTSQPAALTLGGDSSLTLGEQAVTVSVSKGGTPVSDALVCLSKDGEDLVYDYTDASGNVSLDFLVESTGDVTVTVSGNNLELTERTLPVVSGSTYLALESLQLFDNGVAGSNGNGNGICEAGETVAMYSVLRETGGSAATGLSSTLSSSTVGVTILDATANYTDVAAGSATVSTSPWLVEFDASMIDGTPAVFDIVVQDASMATYLSRTTEVVKAPEVEVVALDWADDDGDGILEDGETIDLTVTLKNFGAGRCDGLTARLRTESGNVTLGDTVGTVSPLMLMEEATVSPVLSLAVVDAELAYDAYIVFEDDYGRTFRHDFNLSRPAIPVEIATDPSLGADIIALTWVPSETPTVAGYNVYRSENETGPFAKVNVDVIRGVSYFRDEGLGLLTRYYYRVAAVDSSLVPSEPSDIVTQSTAPAEVASFPLKFDLETSGHPAVGDIDGDGDLEIVMASDEVYIWHHDGQELLDGDGDSQTLGQFTDLNSVLHPAGVTLAYLDDQAGQEIIVSENTNDYRIHIFTKDGTELPGWPQDLRGENWNWATPAVGDVDGDGEPEIVLQTLDGYIWAWNVDGTELRDGDSNAATNGVFYVRAGAQWEWALSGPALFDLDGDGADDIIFGTRNDSSGVRRLMALRYDATDVAGFPYVASAPIICSPAIGDLNNDGVMEIVFHDTIGNLYVVQQDGTDYSGFPVDVGSGSDGSAGPSPALGDMDGDGELEIVYAINYNGTRSDVTIVDTDISGGTSGNELAGWPVRLPGNSEGSPVISDIDGDQVPDIVFGIGGGATEAPDNLYAFKADGSFIDGFPITLGGPCRTAPVICDLEYDGDVDIVYTSWDRLAHVWDMPFAFDPELNYWPTFHGNMARNGVFIPRELVPVEDGDVVPSRSLLVMSPYPNPFNPSCKVRLYVAPDASGSGDLELSVYDIQGRRVRNLYTGRISGGWHELVWDGRDDAGRNQASGVYFMRARSADVVDTHKMSLVK